MKIMKDCEKGPLIRILLWRIKLFSGRLGKEGDRFFLNLKDKLQLLKLVSVW
jgi:hypothetical protein